MSKLWMAVAPASNATRVIAMRGQETLLKAHLSPTPSHCRALPWLLEAMALWQGEKVHAVLCADGGVGTAVTTFYRDWFDDFGGPLYELQWSRHLREAIQTRDRLGMRGDFSDLRQLHIADLLHNEAWR
jgi:hypothetical protein